ncbi:hypothetical protein C0J52_07017 [Blattella germanica]|nr:hypothetical protein C0J52_07017 [Blattella germanica]
MWKHQYLHLLVLATCFYIWEWFVGSNLCFPALYKMNNCTISNGSVININIWCGIIPNLYLLNKINNYLQLQHSTTHKACENVKPQSSGLSNEDKTTIGI